MPRARPGSTDRDRSLDTSSASVAHRGVDPGPLDGGRSRDGGAGPARELLAGGAEVEVQPLQRVGPQAGEPGDDGPAGGAVRAQARGVLDGLDHGRHAGATGRARRRARRPAPSTASASVPCRSLRPSAGPPLAGRPPGGCGRPSSWRPASRSRARSSSIPSPVRALVGDHRDARRGRRRRAAAGRRRASTRGGPPARCRRGSARPASRRGGSRAGRGSGRGRPRRRTSAGRAPTPSGRRAAPAGRPRGGGRPRWSRGRAGRAAPRPRIASSSRRRVQHRAAHDPVPRRDAEPVEEVLGARRPPTRRPWPTTWSAGVRRPPTSSSPVSALNVEDLPEPVAPARATTVWSAESHSRLDGPLERRSGCRRAGRRGDDRATPRSPRRGPRCGRRCRCSGRPASWPPPARTSWSPRSGRSAAGESVGCRVKWCRKPSGRGGPGHAGTRSGRRRPVAPPPAAARASARRGPGSRAGRRTSPARRRRARATRTVERRAGPLGQAADGLVAEDRLEQLLPQHGRPAGDADLGTGQPRGVGEHDDHQRHRQPVDAEGQEPRRAALVGALGADHLQHVLLPVADRTLGLAAQVAGGAAEVLAGVGQQRLPRRERTARTPSARSAAASACSRISVSRPDSTATVTRSACCGLPLIALTTRSRSQPTLVSRPRSSSPVPTNSCQRASTSPRSRVPSAVASTMSCDGLVVGAVGVLAQPYLGGDLLGHGVGDLVRTAGEGADRAVQGLLDDGRTGVGVGRRARSASR